MDPSALPHLQRLSSSAPIVFIGGIVVAEKLRWIRALGVNAEWLDSKDHNGAIRSLINRVRARTVCGVIALNELMGHAQTKPIQEACAAADVYYAVGRKGGQGYLLEVVFKTWERRLAEGTAR